jgi:hypothetical protein
MRVVIILSHAAGTGKWKEGDVFSGSSLNLAIRRDTEINTVKLLIYEKTEKGDKYAKMVYTGSTT